MDDGKKQPVYKRQRFLLDFIRQLNGGASATDIQKLVFLYSQENDSGYYGFIPYKYGPYSFQLAEDIEILRRDNFITYCSPTFYAEGEYSIVSLFTPPIERGDPLIKKVYKEYPYYAINSEILGRLFSKQEIKRFSDEKLSLQKSMQLLFTIGYEGKSLESLINTLIQNDIRLLCDVRKNPLSRKFGFSKSKLEHVLETIGIKYIHVPEVGIDSDKRTSLNTPDDYDMLFADYRDNMYKIKKDLDSIADLLKKYNRIALMCYEEDPRTCHRHIIRDYLIEKHGAICEDL